MKIKLALITILAIFGLVLPKASLAATFSVRLGQPKTPTNQNNFKLTFVALDTETGRNITVKCFKKGPSDGGFSQFDVDKVMIEGGNTDFCDVTNSILNANGSYSFYVTAEAGSTTLTSSTVNVSFNTSGPDTPNSYSKERLNNCDYKIKFRTANDGKTVKVQLFRSDTFNISVGASSVLTQQNIGPNLEGEFVNSVPVCGKDYYYVLRAVDSSDNASGTVGDSFTTTTTTSTTGTVTGSAGNTGAGTSKPVVLNGSSQVGSVLSTETSSTSGTVTEVSGDITPTPSVLGSSEDKTGLTKLAQGLIAIIVAIFVFRFLKKPRSK